MHKLEHPLFLILSGLALFVAAWLWAHPSGSSSIWHRNAKNELSYCLISRFSFQQTTFNAGELSSISLAPGNSEAETPDRITLHSRFIQYQMAVFDHLESTTRSQMAQDLQALLKQERRWAWHFESTDIVFYSACLLILISLPCYLLGWFSRHRREPLASN